MDKAEEEMFFEKCVKEDDLPKNDALKQIVLKKIMEAVEIGKSYTEVELNEIIKKHFSDFALIRRELVDFGYMHKDSLNGVYKAVKKELTEEDYENNTILKKHAEDLKKNEN